MHNVEEDPVAKRRRLDRERKARVQANQTMEQRRAQQAANALSQANRRRTAAQYRERNINALFNESQVTLHDCGEMNSICQFCGSKNFVKERPADKQFNNCCHKGKIKLPQPLDEHGNQLMYPEFLRSMLSDTANIYYKNFRQYIRSYNSSVSFASMGSKIVPAPGNGPYVFKVHGQVYHITSHLYPPEGEQRKFAQLYVIDSTTQAVNERMELPENEGCLPAVIDQIDRFFRANNRIAASYCLMHEIEQQELLRAEEEGRTVPVVNMVMRRDRQSDQRRYNSPTSNEVAMIFKNDDGEPPFERDIHIYPRNPSNNNQQFIHINILSPNLDPMTYAILFPYGEPGWQPNWQCESYDGARQRVRNKISMLQYKVSQTAVRNNFNPIISAGKLTQQWIVDSYLQVEANNLNFVRFQQNRLRAELYQGLADHIANEAQAAEVQAGVPVILPSSFEGSPRNMRERLQDAMSIFGKFGPPDLFITFTANPNWNEIKSNLKQGEITSDRPDLIARVFKLKLNALMEDLTVKHVLGRCIAYVYTIEFQKRGLPHAHILIILQDGDKFKTPDKIDEIVSAEIPDLRLNPRLYTIVTRCMIHGPCGVDNPFAPCMEENKCKKQFPKQFQAETAINIDGYPLYRRRQGYTAEVRGKTMDNRYIVPFNKFLTFKYDAHINVEVCTSLKAVKYIYKYIYKGYDCANIVVGVGDDRRLIHNEIATYIDARYVSAPEAMWRLLESPMHKRSHAVVRLPVHLYQQQRIIFEEGNEQETLNQAAGGNTKLTAWFQLNVDDVEANQFLYTEIPYHYVFNRGKWSKRQRGDNKIVARMYIVGINDQERFYLRLLLLHVPGATSYQFLRTVDGIEYLTFKEAAFYQSLLASDDEWERCLNEACHFQMPKQFRHTFAFICIYCLPTNALLLWEKFQDHFCLDFLRQHDRDTSLNFALHDIESILRQHSFSCTSFGLPQPTGVVHEVAAFNQADEEVEAERRVLSLNVLQFDAFTKIINGVNFPANHKLFYLNGPGGSGKTYLYNTLISFVRGQGGGVLAYASTGIAATLMKGGRTIHSGFKLPIPLTETSVSSIKQTSPEADVLRQASLLIMDEVTMLPKDGLRCIDLLLREVMKNNVPFGGKAIVLGGDWRQTLPVVARGRRSEIVETCLIASPLWRHFQHLTLVSNMRSEGQNDFNQWLLNIGIGRTPPTDSLQEDSVQIPTDMIATEDIVSTIFGKNIDQLSTNELSKRVILSTTNKDTLEINHQIIQKQFGDVYMYYSSDSIVSEDSNDINIYPPEFLHEQTPSGVPPHSLALKRGTIVMLLRNLNPKRGLCNGTRMIIRDLQQRFITCEIMSESHKEDVVFIPRIDITPSDSNLPFTLKRRQFPIIPAFAITINKSQGQTYDQVGILLKEPVFSHGQLYVALSRSKNPNKIKVFIKQNNMQGQLLNNEKWFTKNVVFQEIFQI